MKLPVTHTLVTGKTDLKRRRVGSVGVNLYRKSKEQ